MTDQPKVITLEYLNAPRELVTEALVSEALSPDGDVLKLCALRKLGITPTDGESPCNAWGRRLHALNGLPFTLPYHPDIARAIEENPAAFRFMFFLA